MPKSKPEWVSTPEIAQALGINPKTLRRNLPNLTKGVHYYLVNPDSERPTYRWNLKKLLRYFGIKSTK